MAPKSTDYAGTKAYYDRNAATIVEVLGSYFNAALVSQADDFATCLDDDLKYVIATAELAPGQAVLECGSGNGRFAKRLLERLPGLRYSGVELSSAQVAAARAVNPDVEFREASFEELDLPDAAFDRVLFLESIGYCIDIDRLLDDLARVLRPGGQVFIKNPGQKITDYHDYLAHSRSFDAVRREYGFHERSVGIIPDIDFIAKKFELHGFRLVREEYPFYNDYFYNSAFFQGDMCRQVRTADKRSLLLDFTSFDPERSLSALGHSHPHYIDYHRRMSGGTAHQPRNRLTGCVALVFVK
jgi:ubiquinone/menaquinone biosynthesis C-methylase UbiE